MSQGSQNVVAYIPTTWHLHPDFVIDRATVSKLLLSKNNSVRLEATTIFLVNDIEEDQHKTNPSKYLAEEIMLFYPSSETTKVDQKIHIKGIKTVICEKYVYARNMCCKAIAAISSFLMNNLKKGE